MRSNSRIIICEGVKNGGAETLRTSATQINFQVQKLFAFWLGSTSRTRPYKTVMRRNNFCYLNIHQHQPAWRAVIFRSFSGFGTTTRLIYIADILIIKFMYIVNFPVNKAYVRHFYFKSKKIKSWYGLYVIF